MAADGFHLFDTAIGRCGVAWGARGLTALQLPEVRDAQTRARLAARFPNARELPPPADVRRALDAIAALLRGERSDLSTIALDLDRVPPFHRRVYEVTRAIPPGATLSYGDVAERVGVPGAARAVGQALGRNPFAIVVPCHRVLAAGGKVGGFSANGGVTTKLRLLSLERPPAGLDGGGFGFDTRAAVEHLRAADPGLRRLIDDVGPFGMRVAGTSSVFAALTRSIVYQQLTGKAAAAILARLHALFPRATDGPTPEQLLRASDEKLRGAGLSRAKALALRDLARRSKDGRIPTLDEIPHMNDAAIIEQLTEVRGVGRWTAEMFLMFRLGRPDVLPLDDYGVRKGFAATFQKRALPSREALAKHGARWKPYRTVASWYLWRAAERAQG
jgi:methylated-DNA-[protein]-cysteine S-methyltransferase